MGRRPADTARPSCMWPVMTTDINPALTAYIVIISAVRFMCFVSGVMLGINPEGHNSHYLMALRDHRFIAGRVVRAAYCEAQRGVAGISVLARLRVIFTNKIEAL